MKKMYKMNLFGWLLVAACLMTGVKCYAQDTNVESTLDAMPSVYNAHGDKPALNDRHSCSVIFELSDSYGDGWNGAQLTVSFNDGTPLQELTMTSGPSKIDTIEIGNGVHVTLSWIRGNWDSECSFVVKYENEEQIVQVNNPSPGVLYEFDCNCSSEMEDWPILASLNLYSGGQQGIATDGTYIYSCSWMQSPVGGYSFYKYDMQGSFIEGFNISGASEIRDLTYDGQYFYGGNETNCLYTMDFANKTLVASVNTSCNNIQHCSYDPDNDGFWVGYWNNLRLINRNGQTIRVAPSPAGAHSSGFFVDKNGQRHLYLFCEQGEQKALVYDYNITTNSIGTSPIFDVSTLPNFPESGLAGGSFIGEYDGNLAYYVNVQRNPNLAVIFKLNDLFEIVTSVNPQNGGSVNGGGTYQQGQSCTLGATPAPGYTFKKWMENGSEVSSENPYTFTVTDDRTLLAWFQQEIASYSTVVLTAGNVWNDGTGYQMLLDADANTFGSVIPSVGPLTSSGDASPSVYAQFEYKIPENADGAVNTQNIVFNNSIAIQIPAGVYDWCITNPTPAENKIWIAGSDGNVGGRQNDYTFESNKTYEFVVSRFGSNDGVDVSVSNGLSYVINTSVDPANCGVVSGAGLYQEGSTCTLSATANSGYSFDKWTKNGVTQSSSATFSFNVSENATYVAHFTQTPTNTFNITASADPAEGGSVTGGGTYNQGETCTLTATPNNGYTFTNWTENGNQVSAEQSFSFTVTENASYVAHFTQNANGYTISVSVNPAEGGTVTGAGTYAPGLTITLTATANEGYKFLNWTENGVIQWMTDQYEIVVDRDRTLVANFEALPTFTITAMAGANGTITPQGDVQVVQGADQTFTMTPDFGGRIMKVMVDGIDIGPVESYTFTNVNRDHTIYVSFGGMGVEEAQVLNVNVYPNPAKDMVFVEGEGIETVALYDILGNCLRSMDYNMGKELNVSGLSQGTYILRLTTQDGRVGYKKLMVTD